MQINSSIVNAVWYQQLTVSLDEEDKYFRENVTMCKHCGAVLGCDSKPYNRHSFHHKYGTYFLHTVLAVK